ncbi:MULTISPECIES: hypothetical protein [unclassified Flavobacterium]|uniref:Nmad2 family putative nucleotide modification protein n=1 Tax=unclassified Flavobacterium TaxID=196869 RepID=UPI00086B97B4|nr:MULTISPECIES: hypothetical protein [unclassified Flavobacterium]MBN9286091.1 hypothetical protein [Flavobacterium sp.]ODS81304.1 MAG: hypothetical protein ABS44_19445 [Chryseobacterium sp. SCN 40-13]OJV67285.1 MAG: hypothetical protein BGO42_11555 [Flavobacterium sp. 40-81]
MNIYAYKITRDYGFAPNPFGEYCTLACCKPHLRRKASVGDWIIGTGAVENGLLYHIIFLMKVTEKITFQEYWEDPRFNNKKPVINGSLKQLHGDNIYFKDKNNDWHQLDSHHSGYEGELNEKNKKQDLSGKYVLISTEFSYFGNKAWRVPSKYSELCPSNNIRDRDFKTIINEDLAIELINGIFKDFGSGLNGTPIHWKLYEQQKLF